MSQQFTIFYSWQSDLPNKKTRGVIQNAIDKAARSLRDTVEVDADRDTQGVTGSPNIESVIFQKIDECDLFIADLSVVTSYEVGGKVWSAGQAKENFYKLTNRR